MKNHDSTIEFLLGVARDAIGLRVKKDDGNTDTYDHEKDPEGYIISLINALHCWCHVHGIPWEAQLVKADGLFEEDLLQPDINQMICPSCGYNEGKSNACTRFLLDWPEWPGLCDIIGEDLDKYTSCECPQCTYTGPFSYFELLDRNSQTK
jgi:hypothetical protein